MALTVAIDSKRDQPDAAILASDLDARVAAPGAIDARCFDEFIDAQRRLGLTHGERALCRHLRPIVISEVRYRAIARAAELILSALATVAARATGDPELADELGLSAAERALAEIDPGYPQILAVGRLDMLVDGDDFHVLELNADSPAGITDQAMIHRALANLPHMRALARGDRGSPRVAARALHPETELVSALRAIFAAWSGGRPLRTIAIVDWLGVDTTGELQAVAELLTAAGHRAVCVDPDQLSYARGRLRAEIAGVVDDRRRDTVATMDIDLVYRRIITSELLARRGLDHPLIRAYRARAVCVANSFRTKALNKKAAFAVLTDPRYGELFSEEQRCAIAAHVPWTRRVRPEMVADLISRREQLVLKPNDEYGGKGVMLGWITSPDAWAAAIATAASDGDDGAAPLIVQERRQARTVRLPTFDSEGRIVFEDVYYDLCPFLFAGRAEGAMVRVSATPVCNVSAGAGIAGLMVAGALPALAAGPETDRV
jgi:hypothetical protein